MRREAKKRSAAGTASPKTKGLAEMSTPDFNSEAHLNYVRNLWGRKPADEKAELEDSVIVSPRVAKKSKKKKKKPANFPVESDSDSNEDDEA